MRIEIIEILLLFVYLIHVYVYCDQSIDNGKIITNEYCLSKGFNNEIVTCTLCDLLYSTVNDESLYNECQLCCIKSNEIYHKAVLELDRRFSKHSQTLMNIIKQKKSLHLDIKYRIGAPPYLHMYENEDDEKPKESRNVMSWDYDTFIDYLSTYLSTSIND